jgi:hypothetical protein
MNEFKQLEAFLCRIPGIDGPIGKGRFDEGTWWVKFSIDIDHRLAWYVVQELANVLNYLSVTERLPTVFKPVSPPSYLNGGPREFLSWVIESTATEFSPGECAKWLEGRLPQPVDDPAHWPGDDAAEPESPPEPSPAASKRRLPDLEDCETVGKRHRWFNVDDVFSACYNCRVVRPGQLWRKR